MAAPPLTTRHLFCLSLFSFTNVWVLVPQIQEASRSHGKCYFTIIPVLIAPPDFSSSVSLPFVSQEGGEGGGYALPPFLSCGVNLIVTILGRLAQD